MKHLQDAFNVMGQPDAEGRVNPAAGFMNVWDNNVGFKIQDGPVKLNGVNGAQVTDILEFCLEVYKSLNTAYPCRENALTITKLEEAILWQDARTKDRVKRGVEGYNKQ